MGNECTVTHIPQRRTMCRWGTIAPGFNLGSRLPCGRLSQISYTIYVGVASAAAQRNFALEEALLNAK